MQHLPQCLIASQSCIFESLIETGNRAAIHFLVHPITAVCLDDRGLVAIRAGIRSGAAECLRPVSREPLDVIWVEAMAERMGHHLIGHHPVMPGLGKTAKSFGPSG